MIVVDDHLDLARLLAEKFASDGWRARAVGSGRAALALLSEDPADVVVTDLRMPDVDGLAVLAAARHVSEVIVMTAFGDVGAAVAAMQCGAWHFVEKPVRMAELVAHARRALGSPGARATGAARAIVGTSPPMRELARAIPRVARASAPVLVRGESGTGKELVARAIHAASPRADRAFVTVNCAAIPESLVESELFGHVRGAFTGANETRAGLFCEADGGTLFLDELGDMPLAIQAKLLRVLESGEVRAVGAEDVRSIDVRVIAATHQDLDGLVLAGRFRADLFYRLSVLPLAVPPLRERLTDLPQLADELLARARAKSRDSPVEALAPDLLAAFAAHPWPGNVRELAHLLERLVVLGDQRELTAADLRRLAPDALATQPARSGAFPIARGSLVTLRELENEYIAYVLERCGANKARAAEILGLDPSTLYRRARSRPSSS